MNKIEERIQAQLCRWVRLQYPNIIFRSDGGGLNLPIGLAVKFSRIQAGRAYPDMFFPEPRGMYHGLFLEIKGTRKDLYKKSGQMRRTKHLVEQAKMLKTLAQKGYCALFGVGFEGCQDIIRKYLNM